MIRHCAILGLLVCLLAGAAFAQDYWEERFLGIDLDATVVSKYMWRGYDILDDRAAFQPSINFDLFQTGFSLNVWGSFALSSGFEDLDELDYSLAYATTFFEEEAYALDFAVTYIYYDFPNTTSKYADGQEIGVEISFPNLLEIGPSFLVPSWYSGYLWPAHSGGPERGWHHVMGLAYDLPITPLLPGQDEQALSFSTDLTYNDGTFGSESGFSHATIGLSTTFEVGDFSITPSLNYQWSFEDTVNDEDEFWAGIGVTYSFRLF